MNIDTVKHSIQNFQWTYTSVEIKAICNEVICVIFNQSALK